MKKKQTSADTEKQQQTGGTTAEAEQSDIQANHQSTPSSSGLQDDTGTEESAASGQSPAVDENAAETKPVEPQTEEHTSSDLQDEEGDEEEVDELQTLKAEVDQLKDTLLRRTAEFENIKKRMLRERLQLLEDAKIEALKSFLPINDDLQRTLAASEGQEIPEGFLKGVTMVAEKFASVLASSGVEAIDQSGVPFDVNLHDALMRQPAPVDGVPSDTVLQVLEPGYKSGEKVIRHAKVIVSE